MQITREDITGLVLTGGAGSRTGCQDKGLLLWREKPMIEHVLDRLAPQAGPVLISCNRNADTYLGYAPIVQDLRDGYQGPLAGLEAARTAITTPFVLLSACDTPLLPLDLSRRLQAVMSSNLSDTPPDITYVNDGRRDHYLCALLHSHCLESLGDFLDSGERAVHRWYATQRSASVDFSDQTDAFRNMNTLQSD